MKVLCILREHFCKEHARNKYSHGDAMNHILYKHILVVLKNVRIQLPMSWSIAWSILGGHNKKCYKWGCLDFYKILLFESHKSSIFKIFWISTLNGQTSKKAKNWDQCVVKSRTDQEKRFQWKLLLKFCFFSPFFQWPFKYQIQNLRKIKNDEGWTVVVVCDPLLFYFPYFSPCCMESKTIMEKSIRELWFFGPGATFFLQTNHSKHFYLSCEWIPAIANCWCSSCSHKTFVGKCIFHRLWKNQRRKQPRPWFLDNQNWHWLIQNCNHTI